MSEIVKLDYQEFAPACEPEEWVQIVLDGVEYPYLCSSYSRIQNFKNKSLSQWKRGKRKGTYLCVDLYLNGIKKRIDVHRLVATLFVPNPMNLPEVNHLDLDAFNNKADNLEWTDRSGNERHKNWMHAIYRVENGTGDPPF